MKSKLIALLVAVFLTSFTSLTSTAHAQGTAFTYDGRLNSGGVPANGSYDLQFGLWNAASGPTQVGSTLTIPAASVSNGLFTVTLDFGNQFPGADRWLEIAVRTNGGGAFSTLAPRQAITPTPYAIHAAVASIAENANAVTAGSITGGTLSDSLLSANVARLNASQTFAGNQNFSGRIGIGASAPSESLLIDGGNAFIIGANASYPGVDGSLLFGSNPTTRDGALLRTTAGDLGFWRYGGVWHETMRILNASGNVGIGKTNPATALDVNGTVNATSFTGDGGGLTNLAVQTANSFSGSLSGDVSGTQGATVVSTVGGVTSANVASGANAANAATSANTPNTIVKRDGSGNFSAGSISLSSNLNLPGPTVTVYSGGNSLLRSDGINNFFAGRGAGNLTTTGQGNTANGYLALPLVTTGQANTATGDNALHDNTSGTGNTVVGYQAMQANTSGYLNTAVGLDALLNNTTGSNNIAIGDHAGFNIGFGSPPGDNNIDIGNWGVSTDTNIIRIGDGQSQAFIAGTLNGDGSGLTNLNAGSITGGTLADSVLSVNMASGANAANAATSANTPDTIVKRDGSGNFTAGSLTLNGDLNLPGPTVTVYSGGNTLFRSDTNNNFFAGPGAGNLTMSGNRNMVNGYEAFQANTSGQANTASGYQVLANNDIGSGNTVEGYQAMQANTSGSQNTAIGLDALLNNTTGSYNIAVGDHAGFNIGFGSPPGDNNIDIGNWGVASDTNIIRIGDGQTQTFIAGVINGDGGGLINLNAGNISGGTLSDSLLPANVARLNASQTFTADQNFSGRIGIGPSAPSESLLIDGGNAFIIGANASYPGVDGSLLFGSNPTTRDGALLRTTAGDLAFWRYDGVWHETMRILNASGRVGIGSTNPTTALDVNGTVKATTFSGNGANLTSLNAGNLSSGTVPLAQLPSAAVTNNSTSVTLSGSFSGNGSGLTNLSAGNLSGGTLADSLLSPNVARLNASQTFASNQVFSGSIGIGAAPSERLLIDGGNAFITGANASSPGVDGALLFGSNPTTRDGALLRTTAGDVAFWRYDGAWHETARILNASGNVGVGTASPTSKLQVAGGDLGLGDGTVLGNQAMTIWLTNSSGAVRSAGEIVIIGGANNSFTVVGTGSSTAVLGVVYDASIPNGGIGRIAIGGVVQVQSAGATTRGQHVVTSSTSGKAGSDGTPTSGASIGKWLESGAAAGSWRALLK